VQKNVAKISFTPPTALIFTNFAPDQQHDVDIFILIFGQINKELRKLRIEFFFHSCTVHLDAIKVFYIPTDAQ